MKKLLFILFLLLPSCAWAAFNITNTTTVQWSNDSGGNLSATVQNSSHVHDAGNITSGTLAVGQGGVSSGNRTSWDSKAAGTVNVSQSGAVADTYFAKWTATNTIANSTYTTTDAVNWNTAYNNFFNKSSTLQDGWNESYANFFNKTRGNWKVFYSNDTGVIQELTVGSAGTFLKANGATSAPTWDTPTGTSAYVNFTTNETGAVNAPTVNLTVNKLVSNNTGDSTFGSNITITNPSFLYMRSPNNSTWKCGPADTTGVFGCTAG